MTHEYVVSECVKGRHLQTLNRFLHPVPNSQDGQISQTPPSSDPLHLLCLFSALIWLLRNLGVSRMKLSGRVLQSLWKGLCAVLCEIALHQQQWVKNLNKRKWDQMKQIKSDAFILTHMKTIKTFYTNTFLVVPKKRVIWKSSQLRELWGETKTRKNETSTKPAVTDTSITGTVAVRVQPSQPSRRGQVNQVHTFWL